MTFGSANAFRDFDRSVRRELRYVRTVVQDEFLKAVITTSAARTSLMRGGHVPVACPIGPRLARRDARRRVIRGSGRVPLGTYETYP